MKPNGSLFSRGKSDDDLDGDGNIREDLSSVGVPRGSIEEILNYLLSIIAIFFNAKDPKEMIVSLPGKTFGSIMEIIR